MYLDFSLLLLSTERVASSPRLRCWRQAFLCMCGCGGEGREGGREGDDYRLYTHAQVTCAEISPFLPGRHWSVEGGRVESVSLFALGCPLGEVEAKGRHSEREREGGKERGLKLGISYSSAIVYLHYWVTLCAPFCRTVCIPPPHSWLSVGKSVPYRSRPS